MESPCIRNCCLRDDDICMGCYRSLDEIKGWSAASEALKHEYCRKAEARRELAVRSGTAPPVLRR